MTNTENTKFTAHRILKGSKTFVVLSQDGVEVERLGGKRAERAAAIVVSDSARNPGTLVVHGCRQDLAKAEHEAAGLLVAQARRVQNLHYTTTPVAWSAAVQVEG